MNFEIQVSATPGSWKARILAVIFAVLNRLTPGSVSAELQCCKCGALVSPQNAERHQSMFHPDSE